MKIQDIEFPLRKPAGSEEYIEVVLRAEHFIREFKESSSEGIYWNEIKGAGNLTFYRGTAGILYFYLQLYQATKDLRYKEIVLKSAGYLSRRWKDLIEMAKAEGEIVDGIVLGFYMGIGGIGAVLIKVWQLFEDEAAKKGFEEIIEYYKSSVIKVEDGIYWSDNSPLYLDGGAVLFLLSAYEATGDDEILEMICQAADHLMAVGVWHEDGGLEINHLSFEPKRDEPNFEFGTAGIGYLFGKVYEFSKKKKYLEAAKATATYILSIAVKQEKGFLIPYKLTRKEPLYYLGNCHGPAGTAKLFYQLYKITDKDPFYYEQIVHLVDGMESLGAPARMSGGYWNNYCICCGPAGLLPFYLGLYLEDGRRRWLLQAKKCGEILLGSMKEQDEKVVYWSFAFDRTEPEKLATPSGYQNGAAGIAAMLLLLYQVENMGKDFKMERLIDDPFPITYQWSE